MIMCMCVWQKFNMVFTNNARGAMSSNIGIRAHMPGRKLIYIICLADIYCGVLTIWLGF